MAAQAFNEKFVEWLQNVPEALASFMKIMRQWYATQGQLPATTAVSPQDVPHDWKVGGEVASATRPLSDGEMEAVIHGMADAEVKERAIIAIRAFAAGVMIAAA